MTQHVPEQPGVYALKAMNTKLIYIGSSKQLQTRRTIHKSNLKHGKKDHGCDALMEAYDAGDQLEFEVLELCDNYAEREQYWLDFYKQQDIYRVVNVFDACRDGSSVPDAFRLKMSELRKEKWKDPVYRAATVARLKQTSFTAETLKKDIHVFTKYTYVGMYRGVEAVETALPGYSKVSIAAAARGKFSGKLFRYKAYFFFYDGVLFKLDELLETHQELRAISSQAWDAYEISQEGSETNG